MVVGRFFFGETIRVILLAGVFQVSRRLLPTFEVRGSCLR